MQVLPFILLLPQTEGCKYTRFRYITKAGQELTAQNIFERPEVKQILLQIIRKKFGVKVKMEDIKILYKMEKKYNEKIM